MIFPAININGTSAQGLYNAYLHALQTLQHARDAMLLTVPHGRDYQTVNSIVNFKQAQDEHLAATQNIDFLISRYTHLAQHALDAIDAAALRKEGYKA